MPRIVLACAGLLVGGCFFDAHYPSGSVKCSDGKCPSGLTCNGDNVCIVYSDGGVDIMGDAPDARLAALTCGDPGILAASGGTVSGTTMGMSAAPQCDVGFMNGKDSVYKIAVPPAKQVTLSVWTTSGTYAVAAYMVTPCSASPCMGSTFATPGNPATITTTATNPQEQYIIVDSITAGASGPYSLTVTVN